MKTERVTLLTTPEFKSFLTREAKHEGISVAELVRNRCEGRASSDDATLAALTAELRAAIAGAHAAAGEGLHAMQAVLAELRAARAQRSRVAKKTEATA